VFAVAAAASAAASRARSRGGSRCHSRDSIARARNVKSSTRVARKGNQDARKPDNFLCSPRNPYKIRSHTMCHMRNRLLSGFRSRDDGRARDLATRELGAEMREYSRCTRKGPRGEQSTYSPTEDDRRAGVDRDRQTKSKDDRTIFRRPPLRSGGTSERRESFDHWFQDSTLSRRSLCESPKAKSATLSLGHLSSRERERSETKSGKRRLRVLSGGSQSSVGRSCRAPNVSTKKSRPRESRGVQSAELGVRLLSFVERTISVP